MRTAEEIAEKITKSECGLTDCDSCAIEVSLIKRGVRSRDAEILKEIKIIVAQSLLSHEAKIVFAVLKKLKGEMK